MLASGFKRIWTFSVLLICLSLALTTGSANALTFADSSAEIDWDSLVINFSEDLVIVYREDKYVSLSYADVWSANPDAEASDKDKEEAYVNTQASVTIPGAKAEAYTSDSELYNLSAAVSDPGSKLWAWGGAERWVYFDVLSGTGEITLTADYTISQKIGVDTADDYAYAWSEAWLELYNDNSEKLSYDWFRNKEQLKYVADETSQFDKSGTMEVSLSYKSGDYGYMWMGVYNEVNVKTKAPAPVPEPATMLLLGAGLIGLAGLRRKFRK